MFLMFRLGRPDVLPLDDYSLRKAYATAFRKRTLPSPRGAGEGRREMAALSHGGELVSVADVEQDVTSQAGEATFTHATGVTRSP